MTLNEEIFGFQPVQGIPDSPWWQESFLNQVLLCQLAVGFEYFVHELCRWWQVPDVFSLITGCVYNKNDHS